MKNHRSRASLITRRGIEGPPDLVIEILSPSSRSRDKLQKTRAYARYGVPEYWIVDPANRMIEQYELDDGKYVLTNLCLEDDHVRSKRISCADFMLNDILEAAEDTPL